MQNQTTKNFRSLSLHKNCLRPFEVLASTEKRPKNERPQKILKRKFYYIIWGCWIQIWKNFSDISNRKKVLLVMEVSQRPASNKWPLSVTKLFFYVRYQKNSFRFGFSTHKIYNKIFISNFFEAINFSASVVWRPKLWRPPVFLFFELEQFRDHFQNPWKILHSPSYPYNQISIFFSKGPTLMYTSGMVFKILFFTFRLVGHCQAYWRIILMTTPNSWEFRIECSFLRKSWLSLLI